MASDDNAKVSGAAAADVCTHCGQLLTAGESGNSETPPSKRRSSSTPPSTSSSSKKLRSQGPVPQSRKWDSRPEFPVWVLIHDGCGSQSWVPGVVFKVHEVGDNYEVTVKVKDELTCDWFIPRTINSNNQDPIPSKSINDYLRERNTELNDSTDAEMKRIKCMNYHAGNTIVEEEFPEQGVVGKTLLDSDPESLGSLRNLVRSIMVDESVKQVVKAATGQDLCTTEFALAYFIGQFCGIEISDSAAGDIDPMHLLDQWMGVIMATDSRESNDNRICGIGSESAQVLFADPSRTFYRALDATDHIRVASSAFLKGYAHGYEVAIPPRPFTILRCLHRTKSGKSSLGSTSNSKLAGEAKRVQMESIQSLKEDGHLFLHASHSLLDGLAKAGEGKSDIIPAVLSTMSHNQAYQSEDTQIGDTPCKPILLSRTKADAAKIVLERAKREDTNFAPVHRYVDFAKDLYSRSGDDLHYHGC